MAETVAEAVAETETVAVAVAETDSESVAVASDLLAEEPCQEAAQPVGQFDPLSGSPEACDLEERNGCVALGDRALCDPKVIQPDLARKVCAFGDVEDRAVGGPGQLIPQV